MELFQTLNESYLYNNNNSHFLQKMQVKNINVSTLGRNAANPKTQVYDVSWFEYMIDSMDIQNVSFRFISDTLFVQIRRFENGRRFE